MVRRFRTTYNTKNGSWEHLWPHINHYFQINLLYQAGNDTYDYSPLQGTDFETPEERAMYFYTKYKPRKYQIDFPSPNFYKIIMKVDPCKYVGNSDLCCDGTNEAVCGDNPSITSGTDIGVAWLTTGYVMQCSSTFNALGNCGTFIEIHKPNNASIEQSY